MSGCAREDLLGTQRVARIGQTGDDILVGHSGVIGEDVDLAPSIGHQTDHEFDRQPCATDDRLAGQYFRVELDARLLSSRGSELLCRA
jgi:hypothetical protein